MKLSRGVLLLAALFAGAAFIGPTAGIAAAPDSRPTRPERKQARERPLARIVEDICAKGRCRDSEGSPGTAIQVWRDKRGKVAMLVYQGSYGACPHPPIVYYDAKGKLLMADGTGPREPEDWNTPKMKMIGEMKRTLQEAERRPCR